MSIPEQKQNTPQNPAFLARLKRLIGVEAPYSWAKRMGISKGAFTRIYKEGTVPTARLLERIRKGTGVSLDWLLRGEGAMYSDRVAEEAGPYKAEKGVGPLSKDEELLVRKYRELNPSDKTHFQAIIVKVASTKGVGKQERKK